MKRWGWWLGGALALAVMTGCDDYEGLMIRSGSLNDAGIANLSGVWAGNMETNLMRATTTFFMLSQSSAGVTGTYTTEGGNRGNVAGTFGGRTFRFQLTQTTPVCPGTFNGSALVEIDTMTLTFSGFDCAGAHLDGRGLLVRQ